LYAVDVGVFRSLGSRSRSRSRGSNIIIPDRRRLASHQNTATTVVIVLKIRSRRDWRDWRDWRSWRVNMVASTFANFEGYTFVVGLVLVGSRGNNFGRHFDLMWV
jgi:hypothetical protein